MDHYRVTIDFQLDDDPDAQVDAFGFAVLDALLELDGVIDPDLVGSLARGEVVAEFVVEADDLVNAQYTAALLVQTALHACGENTAALTELIRELVTTTREIVDQDAVAV